MVQLSGFYAPSIPKLKWDDKKHKYVKDAHGHGGGHEPESHGEHGGEHEEHGEHEHDPLGAGGWMFLFIDLVLVALTSKCALVMEYCSLSVHSFVFSATVFTVMFLTRQHLDEYCNRFYSDDIFHRLCYFFYVGAFFTMALNVNTTENHSHMDWKCKANLYGSGFGVAYCMSRTIIAMLYGSVMYDEPKKAFEQFCGPVVKNIFVVAIVVILVFSESMANSQGNKGSFPPAFRIYIYLIATCLEWAYDFFHNVVLALKKSGVDVPPVLVSLEYYPLELMVYQERLGAFIMLVLGESMICLLIPYFNMQFAEQTYVFHMISYLIIFCFGIMYYDGANHGETTELHAVNHSLTSAFMYFWIHVLVGLSIFYTSCAMGILYLAEVASDGAHHDDNTPDPTPTDDVSYPKFINGDTKRPIFDPMNRPLCKPVQLLAAAVGMATILLGFMRVLHRGLETIWNCEPDADLAKARWALVWRTGCGIFHFTVPFFGLPHPAQNAAIHVTLLVIMLLLEIKFPKKEDKHGGGHGAHGSGHDRKSDGGNPMHGFHGGVGGPHARGSHAGQKKHRMDPRSAAAIVHKDQRTMEFLGVPPRPGTRDHPLDQRHSLDRESRRSFGSQGRRSSGHLDHSSGHDVEAASVAPSVATGRLSLREEIQRQRASIGGRPSLGAPGH